MAPALCLTLLDIQWFVTFSFLSVFIRGWLWDWRLSLSRHRDTVEVLWMAILYCFSFLLSLFLFFFSFLCCLHMLIESISSFAILMFLRSFSEFPMVFMLISLLHESEISCYNIIRFLSRPSWLLVESFEQLYYNKVDLKPE